jgi:hypothetical protein
MICDGKYRILDDYGAYEGMKWRADCECNPLEFDTPEAAIKHALDNSFGCKVFIVRMLDWGVL